MLLLSIFVPKGCLEKSKHTSEFPLWVRAKVTRDPALGRCLCEVPASKMPKNADGNCCFQYKDSGLSPGLWSLWFPGLCQNQDPGMREPIKPGLGREQVQHEQQGARYQDIVLVFMVEQWVPQLPPDMCVCRRPLEVSSCKLGEGVLFQTMCFLF